MKLYWLTQTKTVWLWTVSSLQNWWFNSHRLFLLLWISGPREAWRAPQLALHVLDDRRNICIGYGLGYNPTLWWVQSSVNEFKWLAGSVQIYLPDKCLASALRHCTEADLWPLCSLVGRRKYNNVFVNFSLRCELRGVDVLVCVFTGWSFQMGSAYQFHSWRVFVLVCAFPSVAAIAALSAMPESPRFYLEVSRCSFWQDQLILSESSKMSHQCNMCWQQYDHFFFPQTERQTRRRLDDSEAGSWHKHAS